MGKVNIQQSNIDIPNFYQKHKTLQIQTVEA